MDGFAPFSISNQEEREIRQLSKVVFNGGSVVDPEIQRIERRWGWLLELFLQMVDRRSGSFLHLPFAGSVLEQPAKLMSALVSFQRYFIEKINENPPI